MGIGAALAMTSGAAPAVEREVAGRQRVVLSVRKGATMIRPMDTESSEVLDLRVRLTKAEAEAADALFERTAADHRTLWALTLFGAVSRLWEAGTLDGLYTALDEIVFAVLGGRRIAIYLREPDRAELSLVYASAAGPVPAPIAILGEGAIGRAAAERRTIRGVVPEASGPILAVPLGASAEALGSLVLYGAPEEAPLDPDELQFIQIVCRHVGNAILVFSRDADA